MADVAGLEPAVLERLRGRRGVAVVLRHHPTAPDQDLAVSSNAEFCPWHRFARAAVEVVLLGVGGGGRGRLGQPPTLQYLYSQHPEELLHLGVEGRAAADEEAQSSAADLPPHRVQHQALGQRVLDAQTKAGAVSL